MIKAIALDDELPALKILQEFSSRVDFVSLEKVFTGPAEAMKYLRKFPVDLLFLDIQMPSVSGLTFYKEIPQNILLIFTTAYSQYAVEGFNLNAVDYLLKPFSFDRFLKAVTRTADYLRYIHQKVPSGKPYLFIRADYRLQKIAAEDILYIEGLDDYLKIHIRNHKTIVARMTMKTLLERLPAGDFLRVHRSYIVPLSNVRSIRRRIITLADGVDIPVGLSFEEKVKAVLTE